MTTVFVERDGNRRRLSITGHAGYDPHGQDIVCAAASMLGQTLMQYVLNLEAEGGVERLDECTCQEGDIRLDAVIRADTLPQADIALDVMMTGFELLEKRYAEFVNCMQKGEKSAFSA